MTRRDRSQNHCKFSQRFITTESDKEVMAAIADATPIIAASLRLAEAKFNCG
jgi:hypothetical protein